MSHKLPAAQVLHDALNLWWLRPENALALASYVVHGVDLTPYPGKSYADFACGDGVNTFFKSGGRFHGDFDLFLAGIAPGKTQDIAQAHVDVFDFYEDSYAPKIITRPGGQYALGTDHKDNLLKKAQHLDFYQDLYLADLGDEVPAIADESLDLIYCNSLDWVAETQQALSAMAQKLAPQGRMVIDVFTSEKKALHWGQLFPRTSSSWQELLNPGRQETNPGLRDEKGWEALFAQQGLEINEKHNILPAAITHVWNLGLRPIFPMLNKMVAQMDHSNRQDIKTEWVGVFSELLLPLLEQPQDFALDRRHYRVQYVLSHA